MMVHDDTIKNDIQRYNAVVCLGHFKIQTLRLLILAYSKAENE